MSYCWRRTTRFINCPLRVGRASVSKGIHFGHYTRESVVMQLLDDEYECTYPPDLGVFD